MDNFKHLLHIYSTLKKHWSQEVVLILVLTLFPHVRNKRVDTNDHKDFSFFLRLFGSKDRKNFYNMLCWEKDKLRKGLLLERGEMKNFFKKVRSSWRKKEIQRGLRQVDNKKGLFVKIHCCGFSHFLGMWNGGDTLTQSSAGLFSEALVCF